MPKPKCLKDKGLVNQEPIINNHVIQNKLQQYTRLIKSFKNIKHTEVD